MIFNKLSVYKKLIALEVFFQLIEKTVKIIFGVIVVKKISYYLGPADFGNLNFIESFFTLLMGISIFGMDVILVKKFLIQKDNDHKEKIFINGFILIFLSSVFSILFSIILFNHFLNFRYQSLLILVLFSALFNPFTVSEFHLVAYNKIRVISILRTIIFIIISLLKITIVYLKFSIKYFVFIIIVETITFSILIYSFNFIKFKLSLIDINLIKGLFKEGAVIFLYGIGALLYSRIDILMIQNLLPENDLGYYSAAFKLYSFLLFIPGIIALSLFPRIISENNIKSTFISKSFKFSFYLGLILFLFLFFSGDKIIEILYGSEFNFSKGLFKVLILAYLITSFSAVYIKLVYSKNLQNRLVYKIIIGLILNIILNFLLIRKFGVYGAAYSTILALFFLEFIYDFFDPKLREINILKLKSIFYK